jgi:hypothetical protein
MVATAIAVTAIAVTAVTAIVVTAIVVTAIATTIAITAIIVTTIATTTVVVAVFTATIVPKFSLEDCVELCSYHCPEGSEFAINRNWGAGSKKGSHVFSEQLDMNLYRYNIFSQ